jgi:hypothetical protein
MDRWKSKAWLCKIVWAEGFFADLLNQGLYPIKIKLVSAQFSYVDGQSNVTFTTPKGGDKIKFAHENALFWEK